MSSPTRVPIGTTIDNIIFHACRIISIVMMVVLFLLLAMNVVIRWFPVLYMGWFDEIVQLSFAYMVFFGAAAIWRNREHFRIDWIDSVLKGKRAGSVVWVVTDVLALLFFAYFVRYSYQLFERTREVTPILAFSRKVVYACMPISGLVMLGYTVRDLVVHFRGLFVRGSIQAR